MRYALALLLAILSSTAGAVETRYLRSIQERWDVSDLVCIGSASPSVRTGVTRSIDGTDRDQLASEVDLERCLKGKIPVPGQVRVLGYDVFAIKNLGPNEGYGYAGPPVGFVSEGRSLLFLRRTQTKSEFEVSIPMFETAIRLAEHHAATTLPDTDASIRVDITRELEGALLKFDEEDLSDIEYIFDFLGDQDGARELAEFGKRQSYRIERDIAVALLNHGRQNAEAVVISLLLDSSAPPWKRQNASSALGSNGTDAALRPLQKIANQPASNESLKPLQLSAQEDVLRLHSRLLSAKRRF